MNDETERALIARFQSGDGAAFGELFEAHHRRVIHSALQMLRDEEAALDVAQEVFMLAFEEFRYWRGEARLSTWLYRTATNLCFERIRADERQRRLQERAPEMGTAPSPEGTVLEGEVLAAIDGAVKRLPPRQRVIFALRQYEDLRFTVIAELLEITEAGAKAGYHKALLSLQRWLRHVAPEGPGPETQSTLPWIEERGSWNTRHEPRTTRHAPGAAHRAN